MADETRRTRGRPRSASSRTGTVRRARRTAVTQVSGDSASALMQSVQRLVSENQSLTRENDRLKGVLARIVGMAGDTGGSAPSAGRTRSRRQPVTAPETPAPVKRTRRPITDPVALQRRRDALAKARAARAAKLRGEG